MCRPGADREAAASCLNELPLPWSESSSRRQRWSLTQRSRQPSHPILNWADISVERHGGADCCATSLLIAEAFARGADGTVTDVVLTAAIGAGCLWTMPVAIEPCGCLPGTRSRLPSRI